MPNDDIKQQVIHPDHYADGGIEPIDYIFAKLSPDEFNGFCIGNVLRYVSRAGKKGDAKKDIAKAFVYMGWLFANMEGLLGVSGEDKLAPTELKPDLDLAGLAETWKTGI